MQRPGGKEEAGGEAGGEVTLASRVLDKAGPDRDSDNDDGHGLVFSRKGDRENEDKRDMTDDGA